MDFVGLGIVAASALAVACTAFNEAPATPDTAERSDTAETAPTKAKTPATTTDSPSCNAMSEAACQTCCDPTGVYAKLMASVPDCDDTDPTCASNIGMQCQRDATCTAASACRAQCPVDVRDGG
jgi:hypothetical protein